jgi:hypothetical protein
MNIMFGLSKERWLFKEEDLISETINNYRKINNSKIIRQRKKLCFVQ